MLQDEGQDVVLHLLVVLGHQVQQLGLRHLVGPEKVLQVKGGEKLQPTTTNLVEVCHQKFCQVGLSLLVQLLEQPVQPLLSDLTWWLGWKEA